MASSLIRRSSVLTSQIYQTFNRCHMSSTLKTVPKQTLKHSTSSLLLTRGIRHFCRSRNNVISSQILQKKVSKNCSCCGLHTEGDVEFSKFLESEIKIEKENQATPKQLEGWNVESDQASVTLTKSLGTEQMKIVFNVNNSAYSDEDLNDSGENKEKEYTKMVCRPPFTIDIKKASGKVLSLQCSYPEIEDYEQQQNEEYDDDKFTILDVALHDGEWKDKTFSVSSEAMDGTLYDMLMDMLHDRGIRDDFIQSLIDFSTAYEQKQYIEMLEKMKSFVDEK